MKKKNFIMIVILTLNLTAFGNENIENREQREQRQYGQNHMVIGTLSNIRGVGEIKVKPDILINIFELRTENESLEKASDENAKIMNEFREYLLSIGVKENDIETNRYSKNTETVKKPENEIEKFYETSFSISLIMPNDKYADVTNILNRENINELRHTSTYTLSNQESIREFQFVIESLDRDRETSQKLATDKYNRIATEIKKLGLDEPAILNYSNSEENRDETKTVYSITHAYKVRIPATVDVGQLLQKCESLQIKNPSTMTYDISDDLQEKATLEAYEKAMESIYSKSRVILKANGYTLGDASSITDQTDIFSSSNNLGREYGVQMNQSFRGQILPMNMEVEIDEEFSTDIPFSAVQEIKVSVNLLANFEIIKELQ